MRGRASHARRNEHASLVPRYIKLHEKAETVTNMLIRRGFSRRANGRKRDIETSLNSACATRCASRSAWGIFRRPSPAPLYVLWPLLVLILRRDGAPFSSLTVPPP